MSKFRKRAKEISIKAREKIFSEYIGSHISSQKGEGYDFAEIKEYSFGDDIRHIDWTISAKLGRPHVKVFNEENRLSIAVVPLLSGSVFFGTKRLKQDLIAEISSILFFSAVKKQDMTRLFIANEEITYESRFLKRISFIENEIEKILEYDSIGKVVDFNTISKTLSNKIKRKSLIFLVGDFLDGVSEDLLPNLSLLSKKHEVIAVVVRDKLEETLGEFSNISFIDPATKKTFSGLLGKGSREKYQERIASYDRKLFSHFKKFKIRHVKIYSDEDPYKKMLKVFNG